MEKFIAYLFLVLVLIGCETVVDIELPERESQLTVNALINPNSEIQVTVHESRATLEAGEVQEVTNATVTITGSDGSSESVSTVNFDPSLGRNFYSFAWNPKAEIDYNIRVSADGFKDIISSTQIPAVADIDKVDTGSQFVDGFREGVIDITFRDRSGLGDAYETKFYALVYDFDTIGGQIGYRPIVQELYAYFADVGDFFGEKESDLLISDELFDGKSYTQRVNYDFQLPYLGNDSLIPDSIDFQQLFSTYLIVELRTLSQDYYKFQTTYTKFQLSSGDPFAQPVQVYNNIDGGFGIFAGFNVSYDTIQMSTGIFPSPLD